ncbi:hypothetical protein BT69DRAFT_1243884 [Atractiella rhizophila]|nr:hypothetical protein BT69DRAFT_1243884 [Atractiella rhizophila]
MSTSNRNSNVLFVGNLPYDYTEEQMQDMFRTVGPVKSVRLVFERDTGKPRGFGFCEFFDVETASSALRNLNGMDVGGRSLRLDFADPEDEPRRERGDRRDRDRGRGGPAEEKQQIPKGVPVPPGASATDVISKTLATMPPHQLLDVMTQMKSLVTTSPDQARALLNSNPQVTYALFQALLMMNIVDSNVLQRLLVSNAGAPVPAAPAFAPPPVFQQPVPAFTPAPIPIPAPAPAAPPSADAHQLITQVLAMTEEQINMLAPEQRTTILQIRAQAGIR